MRTASFKQRERRSVRVVDLGRDLANAAFLESSEDLGEEGLRNASASVGVPHPDEAEPWDRLFHPHTRDANRVIRLAVERNEVRRRVEVRRFICLCTESRLVPHPALRAGYILAQLVVEKAQGDLIDLVGLEEDDAAGNTDARAMSRHQVHALSTMNLESEHQVRVNLGRVDRAVHVGRSLCEGLCIGIAYELTAIRMDTRSHERE